MNSVFCSRRQDIRRDRVENDTAAGGVALARLARIGLLGQMSASFTHELNQPLTAILSNAQAGLWQLEQPLDAGELRDILHDICRDARRAVGVIRGLSALFKGEKPAHEAFDMNEVVREVARMVANHLVIHNVALSLELSERALPVTGHRIQLQQVVLNLIHNACEAMKECATPDRRIFIRSERTGPVAKISVADLGKGFAGLVEERAYEPFFTSKPDGMGVGLYVCKSIMEAHDGELWHENGSPRGAVFFFTVPVRSGS